MIDQYNPDRTGWARFSDDMTMRFRLTAREAAARHRVAFHFKQWNGSGKTIHLPILDSRRHDARPECK